MSNFLLWLIAQNTTQSLAHQMQKDDPKLWNIAQFSLFLEVTIFLLIGFYFLIPEVFWTIVLIPVVIVSVILIERILRHLMKPDEPKENEVVLEGIPAIWNFIIFLIGIAGTIVFIVWYINYRNG